MLEEYLKSGFAQLELPCDDEALKKYRRYYEMLEESNKVMNLTAISGEEDVARLHFLDSAALLKAAELGGLRVIDVGTGAGFPGLPLKIAQEDIELTLLDCLDKRLGFLRGVCDELGYKKTPCVHARAEEIPAGYRQAFDAALSRAVARLNVLAELCMPYVKQGGVFIAMKGPDCEDELREAKSAVAQLGGTVESVYKYTVPDTDIVHSAIVIRKTGDTPPQFPRRWSAIKKSPLV